jgi:hypothetical protein
MSFEVQTYRNENPLRVQRRSVEQQFQNQILNEQLRNKLVTSKPASR